VSHAHSTDGLEILLASSLGGSTVVIVLGRLRGVDIRTQGSGHRRLARNARSRTGSMVRGFGVIVIDVAKAWLAVRFVPVCRPWLAVRVAPRSPAVSLRSSATSSAIFHGFRGGNGVRDLAWALYLRCRRFCRAPCFAVWFLMMFAFSNT
jgi:glycerol-3-phosphate acyltransferase PlsY